MSWSVWIETGACSSVPVLEQSCWTVDSLTDIIVVLGCVSLPLYGVRSMKPIAWTQSGCTYTMRSPSIRIVSENLFNVIIDLVGINCMNGISHTLYSAPHS